MSQPEVTRVRNAMQPDPRVVDGLSSTRKALEIMEETGVDALVIGKRDDADEYGLITIGMIGRDVISRNRNPNRVSIYEIMEKPTLTVSAAMQARYAIRLLTRLEATHALVTEMDLVVGYVTLRDLTLAEFRDQFPKV
ncbi:CBS domain-containing protein [Aliiroseovarius crassostreae]|uniref:CBS domain-containing protein n=1 Tax=Aliiroseovarius crassostreae TaxID=154981 RepID=A0A9Q9H6P1_9RHOB|nr:CBS domain-containing protein [Aliiroseovarius crassostreae]UWP94569.1 CBS domain-containing protein [Aliiroseovarius crassostreae]